MISKIKQTYRAQYLRDVALARVLDDQTFASLNSIALFNQVDIVDMFKADDQYMDQLFDLLSNDGVPIEKKKDVVMFLYELTTIARSISKESRSDFYRLDISI